LPLVGRALVLATAALLLTAIPASALRETVPGRNGSVVVETPSGLAVVNPAAGGLALHIPGTTARDRSPAYSPDGRRIAFLSLRKGDGEIYVMDSDGGSVRELTFSRANDDDPSWSPAGDRIAFESSRTGGDTEVWVMRADGRGQTRLTSSPGFDGDPSFSPDGTRIAFTSTRDGNRELYVMRADGSDQRRLTFTSGPVDDPTVDGVDQNPSWSPDGKRIAFDSTREGSLDVFVMAADGSDQRRLTDSPAIDAIPVWSPDGRLLLFSSDRTSRDRRELYTMRTDGTAVRRLAAGLAAQGDWQRLGPRPAGCTVWGTIGDDLLPGTTGADVLCGGLGDDLLAGGRGADALRGGFGADRLDGGPGDDRLGGDWDRDVVLGGPGDDVVRARDGARDTVLGGPGRDTAFTDPRDVVRGVERLP
jgi:TolB protein